MLQAAEYKVRCASQGAGHRVHLFGGSAGKCRSSMGPLLFYSTYTHFCGLQAAFSLRSRPAMKELRDNSTRNERLTKIQSDLQGALP